MTNPYRAMCAELVDACVRGGNLAKSIFRARALLDQPGPPELTRDELLRCAKIATPDYSNHWGRELEMMRAAITADRVRDLLAQPVAQEEDCPGCEGTPVASNSPCAVCGRAMCAELLAALESEGYAHWSTPPDEDELCLRARALLAQPVAEGPSDEEIADWHDQCADLTRLGEADHYWAFDLRSDEVAGVVCAALARWGHQ